MAVANIPVHSAFEVVTSQLGWLLYDALWGILAQTGIIFVPIFIVIFELWMKNRVDHGDKKAAPVSLRQMENQMLTMVAVIFLAGTPALTISPATVVMHKKVCASPAPTPAPTPAGTVEATPAPSVPMTYDAGSVLDGRTAEIPVWWYATLLLSGGINNVVTNAIPCTADVRGIAYKLKLNGVANDAELTHETARFMSECYMTARQKIAAQVRDGKITLDEDARRSLESFDSPILKSDWYSKVWAKSPVPPFPLMGNALEERETLAAGGTPPPFGFPNCQDWWAGSGATAGLRQRIIEQVNREDPGLFEGAFNAVRGFFGGGPTDEEIEGQIIQSVLEQDMGVLTAQAQAAGARYQAGVTGPFSSWHGVSGYNQEGKISGGMDATMAWLGNSWFGGGPAMDAAAYMIRESIIILHAIVLMVIYMALPFILVFSRYSWSVLFTTTFTLIAVRFWTVIWAAIQWLDTSLLAALKGMGLYDGWLSMFDVRTSAIS
ncbi:MAG: conjugal transfer protein TraG N-terminal domain-containing protein, partial [Gammaproteobacteria bacterium]|nr:conjugal transfer protein TraG N-terminal domain-containing protein [Gammaproteobacteria bacterium]